MAKNKDDQRRVSVTGSCPPPSTNHNPDVQKPTEAKHTCARLPGISLLVCSGGIHSNGGRGGGAHGLASEEGDGRSGGSHHSDQTPGLSGRGDGDRELTAISGGSHHHSLTRDTYTGNLTSLNGLDELAIGNTSGNVAGLQKGKERLKVVSGKIANERKLHTKRAALF